LAFRILIKNLGPPQALSVLANGVPLAGSPLLVGPGRFDGHCAISNATLAGWVTERQRGFAPPVITVINQHGAELGRAACTQDLTNIDPLFAPARFVLELEDRVFGAGEQVLRVLANGVAFATHGCNLTLQGRLETVTPTFCSGWLVSPEVPGRLFELEIYRDGERVARARCERERPDVRALFPNCGPAEFGAALPALPDGGLAATTISVRLAGSAKDLFDGPYVLANRPAAVHAAFRAARLANQGLPGIGDAERAVIQLALESFLAGARAEDGFTAARQMAAAPGGSPRMVIVIPVYRGTSVTRACIESVLAHRNPATDQVLLINDASPEAEMAPMLASFAGRENLFLLTNTDNLGFVRSVNRGFGFAGGADVLLLNADTVVFEGAFDLLHESAYAAPDIGTVTAMSNNATIFSYPHASLRRDRLEDIGWAEAAALARAANGSMTIDVPTGHGFCMLIKSEVIARIGGFDEGFGRGYGEENDFCARAAALGYRSAAAAGVLVEHKESVSFANEKAALLAQNLPRLNALYPEYTPVIMEFERHDGLRAARWALDCARLARAARQGRPFVLVVTNDLEGGTAQALGDLERSFGYGNASRLILRCAQGGLLELAAEEPLLRAHFLPGEVGDLFAMLDAASPGHVLAHQMLGFPAGFATLLSEWVKARHAVFYAHDFYSFCPRVTMIDAIGRFCDVADAPTCGRCVEMGGAHHASRMTELTPAAHRALFADLLGNFKHVVAPSLSAAAYLRRAFPGLEVEAVPHPESRDGVPAEARAGTDDEIILLGAIGPHKGSAKLLELATRARLTHPHVSFRVIGFTNIDRELLAVGNVTITGAYRPEDLSRHLAQARGRLALFLPSWPETYSYTLSEAVKHGLIPLVPDIGAPAERVRDAQFGVVFAFPAEPEILLRLIDDIAAGRLAPFAPGATPARFFPKPDAIKRSADILGFPAASLAPAAFG
jgi:GT2 family glycosyltransferase/glycosyltransferase involved in cell wall biosynthesis